MMSGAPLETCWAFNKLWNNKFYYKAAYCWYFYCHLRCTDPWISKKKLNCLTKLVKPIMHTANWLSHIKKICLVYTSVCVCVCVCACATHRQYSEDERCILEVVLETEVDLTHVLWGLRIINVHVHQGDGSVLQKCHLKQVKGRLSCLKFNDQLLYPTNVASHFTSVDVTYKTSTCNDQCFVSELKRKQFQRLL
jgi:hypothetical protein